MRIAINCRSILKKHLTGIGRNTFHLLDYLGRIDHANKYLLYSPKRLFDFKRRFPQFSYPNFSIKQDVFGLGPSRCVGPHDVYHIPSPGAVPDHKAPVVVTVHDLIYKMHPQSHTPETIALTECYMQDITAKAAKIICVSESTRRDLHHFFDLPQERSCVVYNGVDHDRFFLLSEKQKVKAIRVLADKGVEGPFLLCVGTIEPRKNLPNVLKALAVLRQKKQFTGKLVVIGTGGWMMEEIKPLIRKLGIEAQVLFLGYVQDEELCYYYNLCDAFIYPSFYEGFGFPIVEAFCCGAAVVTSNVSSCPEIAGEAALTVDPTDEMAIAATLASLVQDNALRKSLQAKALLRGKKFSFLKTATETLNVYRSI